MVAKWILLEPGVDTIQAGDEFWGVSVNEWMGFSETSIGSRFIITSVPCRRRVVDPVCTREAYGSGGAPSPRECGICGVGPCSKADTVSSIAESPDDWVTQDRVPVRVGVDEFRWMRNGMPEFDWHPCEILHRHRRCGKLVHGHIDDAGGIRQYHLEVRCRRKDLPPMPAKTRTVTLREWICWDDCAPGVYTIEWFSTPPNEERGQFLTCDHAHATGNTRTVEVPCE